MAELVFKYSGIAYAFMGGRKVEVEAITEWPGLQGQNQPKIDTIISYHASNNGTFTWGAEARDGRPIVGMKLLLDPQQKRPAFIPDDSDAVRAELRKLGKSAQQVASDYIRALYTHANNEIGARYPKEYLRKCRRQYVITVPAVWSDKAKDATLKAARSAGMHPVTVVAEPEAAALYTLFEMQHCALNVGDAIIVCDAGGGTVDLISYEVAKLQPQLELKELVPSQGGMAGSLVLNKRFEFAVAEIFEDQDAFHSLKQKPGWKHACREFEFHVKRAFKGQAGEEYLVSFPRANLPDNREQDLEDDCWNMTSNALTRIFAPVIAEIEKMVAEQVASVKMKRTHERHPRASEIKAIFLVGGFGSNTYLKRRLEDSQPNIQVLQPPGAWSAIVKGAVLSQLPSTVTVTSSVAGRHYGVDFCGTYDSVKDAGQPTFWDPFYGENRCRKMEWYIKRGDDLPRNKKISFPFACNIRPNRVPHELVFTHSVLICNQAQPSAHPDKYTSTYVSIKADLRNVSKSLFDDEIGVDGNRYTVVDFDLVLTPKSGLFRFACEIEGVEYGNVEAEYL